MPSTAIDPDAQEIYNVLNARGVFKTDEDAQAIGHELRARGLVADPTQGGLVSSTPAAPAAPFKALPGETQSLSGTEVLMARAAPLLDPKLSSALTDPNFRRAYQSRINTLEQAGGAEQAIANTPVTQPKGTPAVSPGVSGGSKEMAPHVMPWKYSIGHDANGNNIFLDPKGAPTTKQAYDTARMAYAKNLPIPSAPMTAKDVNAGVNEGLQNVGNTVGGAVKWVVKHGTTLGILSQYAPDYGISPRATKFLRAIPTGIGNLASMAVTVPAQMAQIATTAVRVGAGKMAQAAGQPMTVGDLQAEQENNANAHALINMLGLGQANKTTNEVSGPVTKMIKGDYSGSGQQILDKAEEDPAMFVATLVGGAHMLVGKGLKLTASTRDALLDRANEYDGQSAQALDDATAQRYQQKAANARIAAGRLNGTLPTGQQITITSPLEQPVPAALPSVEGQVPAVSPNTPLPKPVAEQPTTITDTIARGKNAIADIDRMRGNLKTAGQALADHEAAMETPHSIQSPSEPESASAEVAPSAQARPITPIKDSTSFRDALKQHFNMSDEEADANTAIADLRANAWAKNTGGNPNDWYTSRIAAVGKGSPGDVAALMPGDTFGQPPHALITFLNDNRAVIRAIENPNVTSGVHELGHVFQRDMYREGSGLSPNDIKAVEDWAGVNDSNWEPIDASGKVNPVHAEKFARGMERYLAEGSAPWAPPAVQRVFEQFKQWMAHIYEAVLGNPNPFKGKAIDVDIDAVRHVYDQLLGKPTRRVKGEARAVSEPISGQVPVQPTSGSRKEVVGGVPEPEPQSTATARETEGAGSKSEGWTEKQPGKYWTRGDESIREDNGYYVHQNKGGAETWHKTIEAAHGTKDKVETPKTETKTEQPKSEAPKKPKAEYVHSVNIDKLSSDEVKNLYRERANDPNHKFFAPATTDEIKSASRALGLTPEALLKMEVGAKPDNVHFAVWMDAVRNADEIIQRRVRMAERAYRDDPTSENKKALSQAAEDAFQSAQRRGHIANQWSAAGHVLQEKSQPFAATAEGDMFKSKPEPPTSRGRTRKTPEQKVKSETFGKDNKVYTSREAEDALARLRERIVKKNPVTLAQSAQKSEGMTFFQSQEPTEPSDHISDLTKVGGFILEGGIRKYNAWAQAMRAKVGEDIGEGDLITTWWNLKADATRRTGTPQTSTGAELFVRQMGRILGSNEAAGNFANALLDKSGEPTILNKITGDKKTPLTAAEAAQLKQAIQDNAKTDKPGPQATEGALGVINEARKAVRKEKAEARRAAQAEKPKVAPKPRTAKPGTPKPKPAPIAPSAQAKFGARIRAGLKGNADAFLNDLRSNHRDIANVLDTDPSNLTKEQQNRLGQLYAKYNPGPKTPVAKTAAVKALNDAMAEARKASAGTLKDEDIAGYKLGKDSEPESHPSQEGKTAPNTPTDDLLFDRNMARQLGGMDAANRFRESLPRDLYDKLVTDSPEGLTPQEADTVTHAFAESAKIRTGGTPSEFTQRMKGIADAARAQMKQEAAEANLETFDTAKAWIREQIAAKVPKTELDAKMKEVDKQLEAVPDGDHYRLNEVLQHNLPNGILGLKRVGLHMQNAMLSNPASLAVALQSHLISAGVDNSAAKFIASKLSHGLHASVDPKMIAEAIKLSMKEAQGLATMGKVGSRDSWDILTHGENALTTQGRNALHVAEQPLNQELTVGRGGKAAGAVNVIERLPGRMHGATWHAVGVGLDLIARHDAAHYTAIDEFEARGIKPTDEQLSDRAQELFEHPNAKVLETAEHLRREQMFQNKNDAANLVKFAGPGFAPFPTVAANIAGRAIEHGPGAIISSGSKIVKAAKVQGKSTPHSWQGLKDVVNSMPAAERASFYRTIARGVIGTVAGTALGMGGYKTGVINAPSPQRGEYGSANLFGKKWEVGRVLGPFGAPLLQGADLERAREQHRPINLAEITETYAENPFANISELMGNLTESPSGKGKPSGAQKIAASVAGTAIPSVIRAAAGVFDPKHAMRDANSDQTWQYIWNKLKTALPGLRETLPVKRESLGRGAKGKPIPEEATLYPVPRHGPAPTPYELKRERGRDARFAKTGH